MDIKIKAWDSDRKKMFTDPKWVEFLVVKGELKAKNYNRRGFEQSLKVMQYTGLKDKNGVEIYEGDICRKKESSPIVIEFSELEGPQGGIIMGFDMPSAFTGDLEVIGNIYENPELTEMAND